MTSFNNNEDNVCLLLKEDVSGSHVRSRARSRVRSHDYRSSDYIVTGLDQWHPVAYYLQKMIPAKTWYITYNNEFLAIIKAFKIWWHYLKNCKYKFLILSKYNNFCRFMEIKSVSSRQIYWNLKLFRYHFQIDYHQGKANWAVNILSCFSQRNKDKKEKLWANNTQIFYCLQFSLINATLSGLFILSSLFFVYQVFIFGIYSLLQLRQFWDTFCLELANKGFYKASIGNIRLNL